MTYPSHQVTILTTQQAKAAEAPAAPATTAAAPATAAAIAEPQQGMGKNVNTLPIVTKREDESLVKRQTANFMSALAYASAALKTGPEVQLGTGEGGSGVGITQKAGGATSTTAAAPAKANVTAREVEDRDVVILEG